MLDYGAKIADLGDKGFDLWTKWTAGGGTPPMPLTPPI
jgi:hypothetical protein